MFGRILAGAKNIVVPFAKATGEVAVKYVQAYITIRTIEFGAGVAADVGVYAKRKIVEGWKKFHTPAEAPAQTQATA